MIAVCPDIIRKRADDHIIAFNCDTVAELVECRAVRGSEFLLLAPDCARTDEDICRALIAVCPDIIIMHTDDRRVAGDRNADAELVGFRAVGGSELLLLAPDCARTDEDIRRALIEVCHDIIPKRADDCRVAGDRNAKAELVLCRAVGGSELLLLVPNRARTDEDICRALIEVCPDIIQIRADDRRVAGDRNAVAEKVTCRAVGGSELLLLAPSCARTDEDICRALIPVCPDIIQIRADDRRVAGDRNAVAEKVALPRRPRQ